jgi:NADH-quinone oxidoreductase subunit L
MFVAMGAGAYSVGMFHLFTHAFFKALLFLGAGSVINAMHHEQDIRRMGGLRDKLPWTYATMLVGTLALTGVWPTAGYFSKDAIIEAAYAGHNPMAIYGFATTLIAAALTAFYSWRLIFKVFHGMAADYYALDHADESPWVMRVPLIALAVGSVVAGWPFKELFIGHHVEEFFRESIKQAPTIVEGMHNVPWLIGALPSLMMAGGLLVAIEFYLRRPDLPVRLATRHPLLYQFLLNKWYFDEIYDVLFVRPTLWLGRLLWKGGDGWLIDGFGPDGVSARVIDVTRSVVRLQSGYLYHYAFAMLIGVAALVTWFMFAGGIH